MITLILAILGISFLIFIHELGHYLMARHVGMRVETFAIGFGRPIYSWNWNGVKWQIGWLPFGGFVKIAGTDTDEEKDPYAVSNGFFGKTPLDRIKVACAGPLANLLFAFIVFTIIWGIGGREKNFSELTHLIGWVDPSSELYSYGVRPGDEILSYNGRDFETYKDHYFASLSSRGKVVVDGVSNSSGRAEPFHVEITSYPHPAFLGDRIMTTGVLQPARYIYYDKLPGGEENPLNEGSPMRDSGLQYGDRLVWVDGEQIYSDMQLSELLNDQYILLTIKRGGDYLLKRIPRVPVRELRPNAEFREEIIDWQYEAGLAGKRLSDLYVMPYNLTYDAVVENRLRFIDSEVERENFPETPFSEIEEQLEPGDQIIAVQGKPINYSYQVLKALQTKRVQIIVERDPEHARSIDAQNADEEYKHEINRADLKELAEEIGKISPIVHRGKLYLLGPVAPKKRIDFLISDEKQAWQAAELMEKRRRIEAIEDPQKRTRLLQLLNQQENQLVLGIVLQDQKVNYNPSPFQLFSDVTGEIWRTLKALVSGTLSPKYIAGPIGIVQMMQETTRVSIRESLFWLAAISLNLGLLNLLPIPVLDGGTVLLSLFELISGRKIKPKVLEKLIIPFTVLLIAFFLFLTYNDLSRLLGGFFS